MSGTNGSSTIPVVTAVELHDKVASYRTALVALVALIKREGGFMSWPDQMLVRQIERMLEADGARVVQADLDREKIE